MEKGLTLYQIDKEIQNIVDTAWADDGEITEESAARLSELMALHKGKAIATGHYTRHLERVIDAAREQVRTFEARIRIEENKVKWLKENLVFALDKYYEGRVQDGIYTLSTGKNPASCQIIDETAVPEKYKEEILTIKIDRAAIKKDIAAGAEVPGAVLTEGGRRLLIKGE